MAESPRIRRLRSDLKSLQQLASDSSVFTFTPYGTPPDFYVFRFYGPGCHRPDPHGEVVIRHDHEVHIRLGANYPRTMPDLAWKTPIFHPNISNTGVVCLGGYGTHWAPSLTLDELCSMLWDMLRLENYDESSPYNREAAAWAKHQIDFTFPLDPRPLRDKLTVPNQKTDSRESGGQDLGGRGSRRAGAARTAFASPDIIEAEIVEQPASHPIAEIVFIE